MNFINLIILNLVTILFVAGLVFINVSIYYMHGNYVGMLATGITLTLVAVIMNYEQSQGGGEK